jgi:hypothetical protein
MTKQSSAIRPSNSRLDALEHFRIVRLRIRIVGRHHAPLSQVENANQRLADPQCAPGPFALRQPSTPPSRMFGRSRRRSRPSAAIAPSVATSTGRMSKRSAAPFHTSRAPGPTPAASSTARAICSASHGSPSTNSSPQPRVSDATPACADAHAPPQCGHPRAVLETNDRPEFRFLEARPPPAALPPGISPDTATNSFVTKAVGSPVWTISATGSPATLHNGRSSD